MLPTSSPFPFPSFTQAWRSLDSGTRALEVDVIQRYCILTGPLGAYQVIDILHLTILVHRIQ